MKLRHAILILSILGFLSACGGKEAANAVPSTPAPPSQVMIDAAGIESNLAAILQDEFGLQEVRVRYTEGQVSMQIEQPEALSDEQLMLLYLGALDAAARLAPGSQTISLTIAVAGEPFLAVESDTGHIKAYRQQEIDLTSFVGGLRINVPEAGSETADSSAAKTEEETPLPDLSADLSVGAVSLVDNENLGYRVYATLFNAGEGMAAGVSAQVDVYDEAGASLASERVYLSQSVIRPGEMGLLVLELPQGLQPAVAQVSDLESDRVVPDQPVDLSLGAVRQAADLDLGQVTLVTELQNGSDRPVVIESVLGLLMTGEGEVLAHQFDWIYAPQLLPGESTPVSISWYNVSPSLIQEVERIEILPEARFTDEPRETALTLSASTHVYFDVEGKPHLVGLLRNDGSQPERPVLLGSLYDEAGGLLDCNADWGMPPVLLPGMATAFDLSYWPMLELQPDLAPQVASFDLRVDAYNSYAPQEYEILRVENFEANWSLTGNTVIVEGTADVPAGVYDDVFAILLLTDPASGGIIAAGRGYLYEEGSGWSLHGQLSPDPAYDLTGAELLMDVYADRLVE